MMNEFEKNLIENKIEIIDGLDKAGSGERERWGREQAGERHGDGEEREREREYVG